MRISDWSSDVCSSDLPAVLRKCRTYQRYLDTGIEQQSRGLFPAVVWVVPDAIRATKIRDAIAADTTLQTDLFWTITRSEEHTSELQSLMRISYAVFCLQKKTSNRVSPHQQLTQQ